MKPDPSPNAPTGLPSLLLAYKPGDIFFRFEPDGARLVYAVEGDTVYYVRLHDGVHDKYGVCALRDTSIYLGYHPQVLRKWIHRIAKKCGNTIIEP